MSFPQRFAHLLGIKPKGAKAEDEDEKARGRAEDDDREEEADDDDDDKPQGRKARGSRAADDDDDDERAEDDDDDADAEEDDDKPSGRKAKGKKADDDGDEADAKARGRAIERKRCARIFGSKAAGIRPDMAASLAFTTSLSASAAIAQLEQAAAFGAPAQGGRMSLDDRMRAEQKHSLGPDAKKTEATGPNALVAQMTSLYNKSQGTK
ncbi:hypothetical protein [Pantoea stewartii]|uniref:Uncharacterized protein n=1 Tax=Pantoea stewartii subsp. stewartii DC283 TaxID=660596 RepID=H3RLM3_PANSE|nr:hypothetical protein [Pantoea stewartii]ARF52778.1 hypothetical protein DSJ_26595 [Pantoea stewartii subsp. stewartii DC283]EHT97736.1 hypothetical protein CKS_5598 [Pantoea stewartii subsp. stewartii DC283]KAB0553988.1 hypothetical protein F7Q90_12405 [Pantoea stewartii subsp. stewartii]